MSITTEFLDEQRVPYQLITVRLDQIDQQRSENNQARSVALIPEHVERYTHAYARGATLPEIIVRARSARSANVYVVIGGNHRVAAARAAGLECLPACLVSVDDAEARRLAYGDNERNGVPATMQERLEAAMRLVEDGHTLTSAAAQLGLPVHTVRNERQYRDARFRAAAMGLSHLANKIPSSALARLNSISIDTSFEEAVRVVVARGLSVGVVQELVAKVNRAQPDEHLQIIREQPAKGDTASHNPNLGPHGASPRVQLLAHCNALLAISEDEATDALADLSEQERKAMRALLDQTYVRLRLFSDAIS